MKQVINRRQIFRIGAGSAIALTALPHLAWADEPAMRTAIKELYGERQIQDGRVIVTVPALVENGYSVTLDVEAESPMTASDYVKSVSIFSDRNPIPLIARYYFTPQSGLAKVSGKVRLGGSQRVHAIAEMSDGSLYGHSVSTLVMLAACVTG